MVVNGLESALYLLLGGSLRGVRREAGVRMGRGGLESKRMVKWGRVMRGWEGGKVGWQ